MSQDVKSELLVLNQKLLNAIGAADWETYTQLCDASISCFEPEALGHLVEGMEFHKIYFTQSPKSGAVIQFTMANPHVRLTADMAVLSYYRLTQVSSSPGNFATKGTEETRVWQKINGQWKHVHFHRSPSQTA